MPDLSGLGASARGLAGRFWPAVAIGVALAAVLGAFVGLDPASGVTFSGSPFSDEGWNALNSRNLVLLGTWSTDAWQLQWVHLPYSVLVAGAFWLFGVGIIQLRLVSIVLVALTAATLVGSLARPLGRSAAVVAGIALAGNALILYYGRLGYLEDLAVAGLVVGAAFTLIDGRAPVRSGVLGGLAFAIAIGTKEHAAFAVTGCLFGALVAGAARDGDARRRIAAALATIAMAGLAWLAFVALPNLDAVIVDIRDIFPSIGLPPSPRGLVTAIGAFVRGDDQLAGLIGPIAVTGVAAVVVIAARWRSMSPERHRLAGGAIGWIVFALGIVVVVRYHPNRYALPVVPGLAILIGVGLAELRAWLVERDAGTDRWRIARQFAIGPAVALALLVPGVVDVAGWVANGTARLPDLQRAYAAEVPPGAAVAGGYAPILLMSADVETIVTGAGPHPPNSGDLYASHGVRWYLVGMGSTPEVASSHPAAWAAREQIRCDPWGPTAVCLYRVP